MEEEVNNYSWIPENVRGKIYDDLLSPAMKKLGLALSTVADTSNTILAPLDFINKKVKIYFDANLKKYLNKINEIGEEKIVQVPTEIGIPILERFRYLTNEDLSNAFVQLLATASNLDTSSLAHPGFINIIDRLCPDEALVLKYLKKMHFIPVIYLNAVLKQSDGFYTYKRRTGLEKEVILNFPDNMDVYLDNFESLGLIQRRNFQITTEDEKYLVLSKIYSEDINDFKKELSNDFKEPNWMRECYVFTAYCRLFMNACIA